MTSSLYAVAEAIALEKAGKKESFTAFDITTEVRKRGHFARHAEIRDAVHDVYNRGLLGVDYTRTTISVASNQSQQNFASPFLYHHTSVDPNSYSQAIQGFSQVQTFSNSNSTIQIPSSSNTSNSSQTIQIPPNNYFSRSKNKPLNPNSRILDKRGVLSVPTNLVRPLFKKGSKVYVTATTDSQGKPCAVISDQNTSAIGKYTVDNHDQIRVNSSVLRLAGISTSVTSFDITLEANSVLIKAAN